MKQATMLFFLLLCSAGATAAQSPNEHGWIYQAFPTGYGWVLPRASPTATVAQTVGVTEVMVRYARPAVGGRTVWGELVPWGEVWRAGANEATVISFSTDVEVQGQPLAAGTYGLFMIPEANQWTLIFNHQPFQWGAFTYDESRDALRVTVTPHEAQHLERLQYHMPLVTDSTVQVVLHWERVQVPFTVRADVPHEALARVNASFDWQAAWFAADYFYQQGIHLEEALKWVNITLELRQNPTSLLLKARILAALERYEEALALARHLQKGGPAAFQKLTTTLIEAWEAALDQKK